MALGPRGLWASAAPRTIHLEVSTVGPTCIRRLSSAASASRIRLIDCPVSRGARRDDDDVELVLWVGASPDHYDLARPILDRLGDRVVYCGSVGLGQTTKIVNNLIAHGLIVLVGEALALGVRAGAPLDLLSTALQHGTAQNRVLDELFPASVFLDDFRPGLRLDLAVKDLDLARELAGEQEMELVVAHAVRGLFEQAQQRDWGDLSAYAVVRLIEERCGVRLRSLLSIVDKKDD
jgi:3-hydroxyisobutyrate dehydrogenase-like beta-hydroxyacid dehydrogenase